MLYRQSDRAERGDQSRKDTLYRVRAGSRSELDLARKTGALARVLSPAGSFEASMTSSPRCRDLMLMRRTFAPTARNASRISFPADTGTRTRNVSRLHPRLAAASLPGTSRIATYVCTNTLLRAMVTLQNDHLLPQSYYR